MSWYMEAIAQHIHRGPSTFKEGDTITLQFDETRSITVQVQDLEEVSGNPLTTRQFIGVAEDGLCYTISMLGGASSANDKTSPFHVSWG